MTGSEPCLFITPVDLDPGPPRVVSDLPLVNMKIGK